MRTLTQRIDELEPHLDEPVRTVVGRLGQSYTVGTGSKSQELSPGQLLERLGFRSEQLSTPVKDLSGGQQRRLQLLLVLLDQPNVLILDEPTNDMDTDMLAAMEDLLDTWPGTLIVVSHDRYFIERVTDQQYALLGGTLRHLPGGVDEYLKLREREQSTQSSPVAPRGSSTSAPAATTGSAPALSGAELRTAQKEIASIERRMEKIASEVETVHANMATHDQSDFEGLQALSDRIRTFEDENASLEERWLELSELIDG